MKTNLSLKQITHVLSHFFHRFHILIFVVSIMGGLAVATFLLYNLILSTAPSSEQPPRTTFDKATIEKVQELQDIDGPRTPLVRPNGRTNPFE